MKLFEELPLLVVLACISIILVISFMYEIKLEEKVKILEKRVTKIEELLK